MGTRAARRIPLLIELGSEIKTVKVRPHERTIRNRIYQFVCPRCDQLVKRSTFGPCPKYCSTCRPPKIKPQPDTQPEPQYEQQTLIFN